MLTLLLFGARNVLYTQPRPQRLLLVTCKRMHVQKHMLADDVTESQHFRHTPADRRLSFCVWPQSTLDEHDKKLSSIMWGVSRTANVVDQLITGNARCPKLLLMVPEVISMPAECLQAP